MNKLPGLFTRRAFLQGSGLLVASLMARGAIRQEEAVAPHPLDPNSLAKFVDPLPVLSVIAPNGMRPSPDNAKLQLPYYKLAVRELESKIHRDLKPTRVWGYGNTSPGPTFEVRSGKGVLVEWVNQLPKRHFLPIDHTVHGAEADKPDVRIVTHLHGGKVPAMSDGYPEDWYVPGKSAIYYYPNNQDAAMLWYHDHALGITRLNVYAGLFGCFIVRDAFEDSLNLPKGKYEIPLTMYDRSFDADGQLFYPTSGDPQSPWVPEVFGDAVLVNGKLFPFLQVEPRKYRFRVLNASNARFFHLAFSNDQSFHQIGTDVGLLPAPVALNKVMVAPAERADLVVDFSAHAGESIVLTNDTRLVMQFRVGRAGVADSSALPATLRPVPRIPEASAVKTRILTVGEMDDKTGMAKMMLLNNAHWDMPITEDPVLDSVEIWELLNFTDDSHPIHLHMVRFQILDRRSFEPEAYYHGGQIQYIGPVVPPTSNEMGWKDTVQAHPGMVTRIIVRFEGYVGRYVWHCHILEHEDNEMMRPYDVLAP
jgi:spore coat protein A, manganese oxidase